MILAYLVLLVPVLLAASLTRAPERRIWLATAVLLAALGLSAAWGLETWATRHAARFAWERGWWEHRRPAQAALAVGLVVLGGLAARRGRGLFASLEGGRASRVALGVSLVLALFVAVRALSFHYVDVALVRRDDGSLALGGFIELGLGAVIAVAAAASLARGRAWPSRAATAVIASAGLAFVALATFGPSLHLERVPEPGLAPRPIEVGRVTGVALADAIVVDGTASLRVQLPEAATPRLAYLYWSGQHTSARGDAAIEVNGAAIEGTPIGGPTHFYTWFDRVAMSAYRVDVTTLVASGVASLEVRGIDFDVVNDGAGLLVLYDEPGAPPVHVDLRDGLDLAFDEFDAPLDTTTTQRFEVRSTTGRAEVHLFVSGIDQDVGVRSGIVELSTPLERVTLDDALTGERSWVTVSSEVAVPASGGELAVRLLSGDGGVTDRFPASFSWIVAVVVSPEEPAATQPSTGR